VFFSISTKQEMTWPDTTKGIPNSIRLGAAIINAIHKSLLIDSLYMAIKKQMPAAAMINHPKPDITFPYPSKVLNL
jgi:hypothetical protein